MRFDRDIKREEREVDDSHVTMKDLSKGIAIAQLFVDSLAQHDTCHLEDILKLKRGEWSGQPLTYLGNMFQNNVKKLLQSYNNSANSINYDIYSESETNCIEKRRQSSMPKIMSALFTASTSQSELRNDSCSNGEINTNTQLRRIGPKSPPSPNINNRGIIDNNQRLSSPFENEFSGPLEDRLLCTERRSHSLSSENQFSDNLKGRLGHKEPRSRSRSYENRFSNNIKGRLGHMVPRNRSQSYEFRLSDSLRERLEFRKLPTPSPPTESRLTNNIKDRLDYKKPKYRSRRYSRSPSHQSRPRHQNRFQARSSNNRSRILSKIENKSSQIRSRRNTINRVRTRRDRKYEVQNLKRPRYKKRSRSLDKINETNSYKSKKKSKCDEETNYSPQNQNEVVNEYVNENQYSSSGPPQYYQTPEVITGINSNAMIPTSQPVFRGPVPYYQPPQYGSSMVFYSQPPNRPPIRLQNMPPRGPPPYFMQSRPQFMGYAPPATHFYGPT